MCEGWKALSGPIFTGIAVHGMGTFDQKCFHCRQLSSMSESIAQRVDVAVDMQQKANRVLTHVLGAQYTLCTHTSQALTS